MTQMTRWMLPLLMPAALLLVACESPSYDSASERLDMMDSPQAESLLQRSAEGEPRSAEAASQSPAALQAMLAYVYDYSFSLPYGAVREVADAHAQACMAAGPSRCQVLEASSYQSGDDSVTATLRMRAEPSWLDGFSERAVADVDAADGALTSRSVTTEDLTAQIIDSGARVRALETLRTRLEALLATRDGELKDLLETERELARVQGELDATKARLASLRARVQMSIVTMNYRTKRSAVSGSALAPVGEALGDALGVFAQGMAAVIYFVAGAIPFVLFLGLPLFFLIRWALRRRRRLTQKATASLPAA